jgi:hypothetical protein
MAFFTRLWILFTQPEKILAQLSRVPTLQLRFSWRGGQANILKE